MNYDSFFNQSLEALKVEGRYRVFIDVERHAGRFPYATYHSPEGPKEILLWCGNDYLGMGEHPEVLEAMKQAIVHYGAGSGGTRNISGTTHGHVLLEDSIARFHNKDKALIFTSGYIANETTLSVLGEKLTNCVFLSDEKNHASIIHGIRSSRAEKLIFKHNDLKDLRKKLQAIPPERPKIIVFESVYSMDGDIAPIKEICDLAQEFNALTYLDEVHGVGLYGETGSGIAERDGAAHRVDIIQGTFGKAFGLIGGYITGSHNLVDFIRSHGPGFIFTTSLPPAICAGVSASLRIIQESALQRQHLQKVVNYMKEGLKNQGISMLPSTSHIIPILVGNARVCKEMSDLLLNDHGIYVQPINYPTVPKGMERLRVSPSAKHTEKMAKEFVEIFASVWRQFEKEAA